IPFADTPDPGGEYKVWLTSVANYDPGLSETFGFRARYSKAENFKVCLVVPPPQSIIRGRKFYDINENGVFDPLVPGEVPIAGWKIQIYKGAVLQSYTLTDDMGRYTFLRDMDGTIYTIKEVAPGAGFIPNPGAVWLNMTPTQGNAKADLPNVAGPDFG